MAAGLTEVRFSKPFPVDSHKKNVSISQQIYLSLRCQKDLFGETRDIVGEVKDTVGEIVEVPIALLPDQEKTLTTNPFFSRVIRVDEKGIPILETRAKPWLSNIFNVYPYNASYRFLPVSESGKWHVIFSSRPIPEGTCLPLTTKPFLRRKWKTSTIIGNFPPQKSQ
jgi:hypothetical protein